MRAYFDAVEPYETQDIEAAVRIFLQGSAPGHNPAFAPSAPQVGAEVRRQMNLRLDGEYRDRLSRPQLPPPEVEKSPESRARVKAMTEHLLANLSLQTMNEVRTRYTVGDQDEESAA